MNLAQEVKRLRDYLQNEDSATDPEDGLGSMVDTLDKLWRGVQEAHRIRNEERRLKRSDMSTGREDAATEILRAASEPV